MTTGLQKYMILLAMLFANTQAYGQRVADSLLQIYPEVRRVGAFYAVRHVRSYALFNSKGMAVTPFAYSNINKGLDHYLIAQDNNNGKSVLLDTTGIVKLVFGANINTADTVNRVYKCYGCYQSFPYAYDEYGRSIFNGSISDDYKKGLVKVWRDHLSNLHSIVDTSGKEILPRVYNNVIIDTNYLAVL